MTDRFGAINFPIAPPASGEPVTDPALRYLVDFCAAVMTADAGDAWGSVSGGEPIVKKALTHDPEKGDVSDKDFPALFAWRESSAPVFGGDDRQVDLSTIHLLWTFEPGTQAKQALREPIFNGVVKALLRAFWTGRHPAWKLDGDTDVGVAKRGSLIWKKCNFTKQQVKKPSRSGLTIELYNGGKLQRYDGILLVVEAEESLDRDPSAYVGGAPAAATVDLTNPATGATRLRAVEDPAEEP